MPRTTRAISPSPPTARLEGNKESAKLEVQVEAGDDTKNLPAITVVPQLELRRRRPRSPRRPTPPAHRPDGRHRPHAGRAGRLGDGDRVRVQPPVGRRGRRRHQGVDPARKLPEAAWSFPRPGVAVATLKFGTAFISPDPFGFTVAATDVDGFKSRSSPAVKVVVREDAKPTLTIDDPAERTDDRTPKRYVPLRATAEDDYGIASVNLMSRASRRTSPSSRRRIPLLTNGKPETATECEARRRLHQLGSQSSSCVGYQWELARDGRPAQAWRQARILVR